MAKKPTLTDRIKKLEEALGLNKDGVTRIAVVQDRSSSMGHLVASTIEGFNEYVESQKKEQSDEATLTLAQFDTEYELLYVDKPIADVPELTTSTYITRGMTALCDAIGRTVHELDDRMDENDRALVVVMTDGGENSSREFTTGQVKALLQSKEKAGNWTFVFLGAGIDAFNGGMNLGFVGTNTFSYAADSHAHGVAYNSLSTATSSLRGGTAQSVANLGETIAKESKEKVGSTPAGGSK